MAESTPTGTIFFRIRLLLQKVHSATTEPILVASFPVPSAMCGGIPISRSEGAVTNPAPPAIESINPATKNATIQKINTPKVISMGSAVLLFFIDERMSLTELRRINPFYDLPF